VEFELLFFSGAHWRWASQSSADGYM